MQCWKDHQCVLGNVAHARSEEYLKLQSVQRILAVPKDERGTIFHDIAKIHRDSYVAQDSL